MLLDSLGRHPPTASSRPNFFMLFFFYHSFCTNMDPILVWGFLTIDTGLISLSFSDLKKSSRDENNICPLYLVIGLLNILTKTCSTWVFKCSKIWDLQLQTKVPPFMHTGDKFDCCAMNSRGMWNGKCQVKYRLFTIAICRLAKLKTYSNEIEYNFKTIKKIWWTKPGTHQLKPESSFTLKWKPEACTSAHVHSSERLLLWLFRLEGIWKQFTLENWRVEFLHSIYYFY